MKFPNKVQVDKIRQMYPKGMRVELESMSDPYTKLVPGSLGVVDFVDDAGGIHIKWDNGEGLAVIWGEDCIRKIPRISETLISNIMEIRATGKVNMFDCNAVQKLAFDMKFYKLVDFIETDRKAYSNFILTGGTEDVE